MIYGVGIDLLDFKQVNIENEKLVQKILTDNERILFSEKKTNEQKIAFFAGRFAVKEAYVKALGTGFRNITFQNIEILNNAAGQPIITLLNMTDENIVRMKSHVSLSHSEQAATAIVILEQEGEKGE